MRIRNIPSAKERASLTRIYGPEENWNGVQTDETKKRRAVKDREKRRSAA